jgi:transcriptional regulator with XRE-family HTH domain
VNGVWDAQRRALGSFIRDQRRLARLSLRQLSALSHISNPYLSQVERGLHVPSVRVLQAIADALDLSAETLLEQAGLVREHAGPRPGPGSRGDTDDDRAVERAVRADRRLSHAQKEALIAVYRSYVESASSPSSAAAPDLGARR